MWQNFITYLKDYILTFSFLKTLNTIHFTIKYTSLRYLYLSPSNFYEVAQQTMPEYSGAMSLYHGHLFLVLVTARPKVLASLSI